MKQPKQLARNPRRAFLNMGAMLKLVDVVIRGILWVSAICVALLLWWMMFEVASIVCMPTEHVPDQELIDTFYRHRSDLEALVRMYAQENEALHISRYQIPYLNGVSALRMMMYRVLFRKIGVIAIHASLVGRHELLLPVSKARSGNHYSLKGYAYLQVPPRKLSAETDAPFSEHDETPWTPVYRYIEGKWYLYYDFNTPELW